MLTKENFIIPTVLHNTNHNGISGGKEFDTIDKVFIESVEDYQNIFSEFIRCKGTDYALYNDTDWYDDTDWKVSTEEKYISFWLRSNSASFKDLACVVSSDGYLSFYNVHQSSSAVRPALRFRLPSQVSAENMDERNLFEQYTIGEGKDSKGGIYHTYSIKALQYPMNKVPIESEKILNAMYRTGRLEETGKSYTGAFQYYQDAFLRNKEYRMGNDLYVRVNTSIFPSEDIYSDYKEYHWLSVEPIRWKIKNWDELPKYFNPNGSGKAEFIDCVAEKAMIAGIPFSIDHLAMKACEENFSSAEGCMRHKQLYQNSTIRGFLNGINVNNIKENGNLKYTALGGGNFEGKGFLDEALHNDEKENYVNVRYVKRNNFESFEM